MTSRGIESGRTPFVRAGLEATATLMGLNWVAKKLGLFTLDFPRMLGTLVDPHPRRARPLGRAIHLTQGVLFTLPYAWLGRRSARSGAALGTLHAGFATAALAAMPYLHPRPRRAGLKRFSPTAYGPLTIPAMIAGHVLYGALVGRKLGKAELKFERLSLDPDAWHMVTPPGQRAQMVRVDSTLETAGGTGLYWYRREPFDDFVLRTDWRVSSGEDNSGIYLRIPPVWDAKDINRADRKGYEIQIDDSGYSPERGSPNHREKYTGAVYDRQGPAMLASNPVGEWNRFVIRAEGKRITVELNGKIVNEFRRAKRRRGFLGLQAHHPGSKVQFRNLEVARL